MARSLSQLRTHLSILSNTHSSATRLVNLRHRSNSPEILFSGDIPAEEIEKVAIKNLEEAIHKIIVKKSEPDWIPFVPGASYWVPPKSKSQGLAHVVGKLAGNKRVDKSFSLSSNRNRGWPSSAHFFKGFFFFILSLFLLFYEFVICIYREYILCRFSEFC